MNQFKATQLLLLIFAANISSPLIAHTLKERGYVKVCLALDPFILARHTNLQMQRLGLVFLIPGNNTKPKSSYSCGNKSESAFLGYHLFL